MAKIKIRKMESSDKKRIQIGLFLKSTLIGCILAIPVAGALKVDDLQLEKDFHGLGYDEVLLEEIKREASESGLQKIAVEILPHAYNYYKSMGFQLEGDKYVRDGIEYRMVSMNV